MAGCSSQVLEIEDIVYVPGSKNPKHQLDLYLPVGKTTHKGGFPMVVFVHGGYWVEGDRDYYALFTGLYGASKPSEVAFQPRKLSTRTSLCWANRRMISQPSGRRTSRASERFPLLVATK